MVDLVLQAEVRGDVGSASSRRLRRAGRLPAVLYGHGMENLHLSLPGKQVEQALQTGAHILMLEFNGQQVQALVREVQQESLTDKPVHLDLYRVVQGERVRVPVPVVLVGEPHGVTAGGILDQVIHALELECMPDHIPDGIELDITGLDIGNTVLVRELKLPEGTTVRHKPDSVVVTIHPPKRVEVTAEEAPAEEEGEAVDREKPETEAEE